VPVLRSAQDPEPVEPEIVPAPQSRSISYPTLEELEQTALSNSPALAQAAADVRALQGKWVQVGLGPNPQLGYLGTEIGNDGRAGQQGAFVSQEFVTNGKLNLARHAASAEIAAARQVLDAMRQRVLADVRLGYYRFLIARRQAALARELRVGVLEFADRTRQRQQAGFASQADVLLAEVETTRLTLLAENSDREESAAWRQLVAVVGQPELPRPEVPYDRVAAELAAAEKLQVQRDETIERLMATHPLLSAAAARAEQARREMELAYAQAHPNVEVQAALQFDNASEDTITTLQVGMPIPIFNRNQGRIQQAEAELASAQLSVNKTELALLRDLEDALLRYDNAKRRVAAESQIRRQAETSRELLEKQFMAAEGFDYLKFFSVRETAIRASIAELEALRELITAGTEIENLLLKDSLN
jgi:cobalt-zinc-cadmium efflux system outer membrane protein